MIKKIVALLLAVSLMCPVAVEASLDIDIGNDGSFVEFAKEKLVIKEGKKKKDKINFYDGEEDEYYRDAQSYFECRFRSTKKKVASVSSNGTVKAKRAGTAYIKCIIYDYNDDGDLYRIGTIKNKVVVKAAAKLLRKRVTLYVKDKFKVPVSGKRKKIKKWRSKNPRIARVTKHGRIIAKRKGRTTITCRIKGKKKSIKVRVRNPYIWNTEIVDGQKEYLYIYGHSNSGKRFSSSNPRVIKVTKHGKIIAKRRGKATIRCKSSGVWIKRRIKVKQNRVTFIKSYKSLSDVSYGNVQSDWRSMYFRGNKLILKMVIFNKTHRTVKKISYGKFKFYKNNKWLFSKSVHNRRLNLKPFRKKTIRIVLSKKRKWKRKVDLTWYNLYYTISKVDGFYYKFK